MGKFKETFFFGTKHVVCHVTFADTDRDDIREIVTEVSGCKAIDAILNFWSKGKLSSVTIAISVDDQGWPTLTPEQMPDISSMQAYFDRFSQMTATERLTDRHRQYRGAILAALSEIVKGN